MGIQGLLPLLKSIMVPIHIKDLEGCSVAVDTYSWLHKGALSCSTQLCKGLPTSRFALRLSLSLSLYVFMCACVLYRLSACIRTFCVHLENCGDFIKLCSGYACFYGLINLVMLILFLHNVSTNVGNLPICESGFWVLVSILHWHTCIVICKCPIRNNYNAFRYQVGIMGIFHFFVV